ncbi:MAG TPA: fumarylacetoacetate hydrolase family protein [Terriglobales bacterium]|nr:fumarylacetoacetate hydrolase family protein [Terriglobales bacterium]
MPDFNTEDIARELLSASQKGTLVPAPLSSRPGFNLDTAYDIENLLKQWHEAGGHKGVGLKVGYANKAMWRVLKLETLVWGHMYDDTVHQTKDNAASLALPRARSLKLEPEIVFGLKHEISTEPGDAHSALEAADWIALGYEIIDCPYPDWRFQPSDFVASFGLHAALVIGDRTRVTADLIPKLLEQLPLFKVRMMKNGELVEEGSGKNSLRSPALCLAELARAVAQRFPNELLRAGDIVSSGTLTSGHLIDKGEKWRCEVEGLSLPALSFELQ